MAKLNAMSLLAALFFNLFLLFVLLDMEISMNLLGAAGLFSVFIGIKNIIFVKNNWSRKRRA